MKITDKTDSSVPLCFTTNLITHEDTSLLLTEKHLSPKTLIGPGKLPGLSRLKRAPEDINRIRNSGLFVNKVYSFRLARCQLKIS